MTEAPLIKKINTLPLDIVNYIYSFRPAYRIDMWYKKYHQNYNFLRTIAEHNENRKDTIYHLFYRFFPYEKLYSVIHVKHRERQYDYSWYWIEDATDVDDVIQEILEKFTILYLDDKNHYTLYKLHLNYMVLAKMIQNNEPI